MNAVNLIPAGSRKRPLAPAAGRPTLALIGGLVVVLLGAVLYVTAANKVKSRQAQLAQVTASVESWRRVAGSYQSFIQTEQQRGQELADIKQLAAGRYPWEQLLSQIGGLMPTTAALTSLQASTSGSPPGSAGGSSSPVTPTTGSATQGPTGSATQSPPAVALSGCAASQSTVAQTMVELRRIRGVTAVTLASSIDSSAGGSTSGNAPTTGQGGTGSCPFPIQFQMSLTFASPASAPTAASKSAGAVTAPTSSPSAPATTGSGSSPTASAATNSTGVKTQ